MWRLWLAALLAAGCVSSSGIEPSVGTSSREAGRDVALQSLIRLRYSSPENSGSVRLILRRWQKERFDIEVSDSFGRTVLGIVRDHELSWIVNHRRKAWCVSRAPIHLQGAGLEIFELGDLPRLILGEFPVGVAATQQRSESEIEVRDPRGRLWRVVGELAKPNSWTLWVEEEPTLWWQRLEDGFLLSQRGGNQVRWQIRVEESVAVDPRQVSTPADYVEETCNEADVFQLREDQSPSGSPGAAR